MLLQEGVFLLCGLAAGVAGVEMLEWEDTAFRDESVAGLVGCVDV
jgi:hypothetical protein